MFNLKNFGLIVQIWMSLAISTVLSIMMPLMAVGTITGAVFFKGLIISFVISIVLCIVIPAKKWGDALAATCKAKPHSFMESLISAAVQTIIYATIITLCMVAINAGVGPHFIYAWLSIYPAALAAVYVVSLIFAPVAVSITKSMCGIKSMGTES